jgi:hypothetical protein
MNLRLKLDVTKLDKTAFFKGKSGTYVDLVLWENDEPDQYGNTHSVKQDMGKERRGEKTPYVGNAKPFGNAVKVMAPENKPPAVEDDDDGLIPF